MHMEKLLHTFTLKNITARPMGYVRFGLFFLTFLIARIPLWFIIVCAFLLNGTIGITYTLFLSFAVIMCRIFVDSEIAGGSRSFQFFLGMHLLRGVGALLFYFILFGIIIYIIAPHSDIIGKISMIFVIILLYYFMFSGNAKAYWNGYYMPFKLSVVVCFLWLYLAFIPDNLFMNILIVLLIYTLEFYNLLCNKPLGMLPNRNTINNLL